MLLEVKNLVTSFATEQGPVAAVRGVSFNLEQNKILGIVGESGCGKTVTALSITGLLPKPFAKIESGEILFSGKDLTKISSTQLQEIRGRHISMIFQEPMSALNPVLTIGKQIEEAFYLHFSDYDDAKVRAETISILKKVGVPSPEQRYSAYPHQLSGGLRQRVMIAIALACRPEILIADEPTTALDVTIQAQILDLMKTLQQERQMAIILITHDFGLVAQFCDEVVVMYGGQIVEQASVEEIFAAPTHPYTKGLLASIPRLENKAKEPLKTIRGMVPTLHEMPKGCSFANRCEFVKDACRQTIPPLEAVQRPDHHVRCIRWREIHANA